MTDRAKPTRTASSTSLSTNYRPNHSSKSTTDSSPASVVRSRSRRLVTTEEEQEEDGTPATTGLLSQSSFTAVPPPSRASGPSGKSSGHAQQAGQATLGQFFNETWNSSWASLSGLTSSFLSPNEHDRRGGRSSRPTSQVRAGSSTLSVRSGKRSSRSWGPAPPTTNNPGLRDVASGSLAEREAALKAARTASVLESHEAANGGLDITGKHKRRTSDDFSHSRQPQQQHDQEDYLVYVHEVQPNDSFVGVVLKYKCKEDVLRKANGLWSRDSVQTRKWLTLPVDACEIKGRPCDPPSWANSRKVDLLAPTPVAQEEQGDHDDFFAAGTANEQQTPKAQSFQDQGDKPWTHLKWVKVEGFQEPVEIGRVARTTMGYFPPRRRKSLRTISSSSTPRQSVDLSSAPAGSMDGMSSRRMSSLSNRPPVPGTPGSTRSRGGSEVGDSRPSWMRRPGGVGSMGKNVRSPGPENDYFNTWTKKHIPGLNLEGVPSMAIMGTEQARFGFGKDSSGLAESSFEEGRNLSLLQSQGTGLDKAAATVESWLRTALTKKPGTPILRGRGRSGGGGSSLGPSGGANSSIPGGLIGGGAGGDLIELADTSSDDGKFMLDRSAASTPAPGLLQSLPVGSTGRSNEGSSTMTNRLAGASGTKDTKGD